jgi:hypothetical protein
MTHLTQAPELDSIDRQLERIIAIKAALKSLDDELAVLKDSISALVDKAELDHSFSFNDWIFTYSLGRAKWKYPSAVNCIDTQLKAAKKAAEADGSATKSLGDPFWTISEYR